MHEPPAAVIAGQLKKHLHRLLREPASLELRQDHPADLGNRVPGDPPDIAAFLRAHAPPGIPNSGEGELSTAGGQTISYDVFDAEPDSPPADLDITVAALGAGMAGIRANAEVVPADATCTRSGGPAPTARGNAVARSRRLSS